MDMDIAGGFNYNQPHPLLMHHVLRNVFNHLSHPTDLRNCRLVNRAWNLEACEAMQKRFVVTFLDQYSISTYLTSFPSCLPTHPHTMYQFYNIDFSDSNSILNQFLTEFGYRTRVLILQLSEISYEKLYNILCHQTVNLQTLCLRSMPIPAEDWEVKTKKASGSIRSFPSVKCLTLGTRDFTHTSPTDNAAVKIRQAFVQLLKLFPNLMKISLSKLDHVINSTHCLNVLRGILSASPKSLKYLTYLDFPLEVNEELLSDFINLGCPYLNELDLTLTSAVRTQLVAQFFNMIAPTASKLALSFPRTYPYGFQHSRFMGQDLRQVTDLTLSRFRWYLGFLENLLLLEKLVFKDTDVSSIFPVNMSGQIKLRVLKIEVEENSMLPRIEAPVFGNITRAFPWLKVLHVPGVTDGCLRVFYFDLPSLTSLECVKGEFTDYGITGVELEICKDLAETTTYLVVNADKLRTDLFIGNLTNLKHLKLESDAIGDLSILFGVCKCLKLNWLYLKTPLITDLAVEALADQLGHTLQSLNILNCPEVSEAGKFYFRESLPVRDILVTIEPNPENDRATERANASRYHRYCDTFVRRKLANSRASDRVDEESFASFAAANAGRRLSRHLHHRLAPPNNQRGGQEQAQLMQEDLQVHQQDLEDMGEEPFVIDPLNEQEMENLAMIEEAGGAGLVGNFDPYFDEFIDDIYP